MVGKGKMSGQLLASLFRACQENETLNLSPAEQTRDFISVQDVCAMIAKILNDPKKAVGEVFNLASGKEVSIRHFAETVQRLCHGKGTLNFGALPYRTDEAMRFYANTQKFQSVYGEMALQSLETMIQAVL
jgi:nucleoside-diphosphate-sugar epimerase